MGGGGVKEEVGLGGGGVERRKDGGGRGTEVMGTNKDMAFTLSLALDPTFRIDSRRTLDTAQPCHLLKPN